MISTSKPLSRRARAAWQTNLKRTLTTSLVFMSRSPVGGLVFGVVPLVGQREKFGEGKFKARQQLGAIGLLGGYDLRTVLAVFQDVSRHHFGEPVDDPILLDFGLLV